MPITSKIKQDQHIYLPLAAHDSGVHGSIITFQIHNYNYVARHGKVVGNVNDKLLNELIDRAQSIF